LKPPPYFLDFFGGEDGLLLLLAHAAAIFFSISSIFGTWNTLPPDMVGLFHNILSIDVPVSFQSPVVFKREEALFSINSSNFSVILKSGTICFVTS
jgi:hypothetical protein